MPSLSNLKPLSILVVCSCTIPFSRVLLFKNNPSAHFRILKLHWAVSGLSSFLYIHIVVCELFASIRNILYVCFRVGHSNDQIWEKNNIWTEYWAKSTNFLRNKMLYVIHVRYLILIQGLWYLFFSLVTFVVDFYSNLFKYHWAVNLSM